ncbi:MAG: AAA family ATPase [Conexivisphaerales archaeon]
MVEYAMRYIAIQGSPVNWIWSLRTLGKNEVGPGFHKVNPNSERSLTKNQDKLLWAFRQKQDFNRLSEILQFEEKVQVLVISTVGNSYQLNAGGVIAFGEIVKEDVIGELKWDYWPEGSGWDYKFYIRITKLAPKLQENLTKLNNIQSPEIGNLVSVMRESREDVLPVVPKSVTRGSLSELDHKTFDIFEFLASKYWVKQREVQIGVTSLSEDLQKIATMHLLAGKNIIVYGPPGVGKTIFAKSLCENLGIGFRIETGNPEWTAFDVIGGYDINNKFRIGFLTDAVVSCHISLKESGRPYWLIIDEINRANLDLSFGNAFTTLDLAHRPNTPLVEFYESLDENKGKNEKLMSILKEYGSKKMALFVPLSFRIIGTMNSYDRTLLFRLGFAMIRRFAFIPLSTKKYTLSVNDDTFIEQAKILTNESNENWKETFQSASRELMLKGDIQNDSVTFRTDSMPQEPYLIDESLGELSSDLNAFRLIHAICQRINEILVGSLEVGMALEIDAMKFMLAATSYFGESWKTFGKGLVDQAVNSYILPQFDALSEQLRAEALGMSSSQSVQNKVKEVNVLFKNLRLNDSLASIERIMNGERIF